MFLFVYLFIFIFFADLVDGSCSAPHTDLPLQRRGSECEGQHSFMLPGATDRLTEGQEQLLLSVSDPAGGGATGRKVGETVRT